MDNMPAPVSNGAVAFTPDDVALIRATVAKGATDAEFRLLLVMAKELGLNPLLKEIWCIKRREGDAALIMTSRDGYLKVARRDPAFQGLSSCAVREGDDFRFDASTGAVHHAFGVKRGALIGAWASAYARGRRHSTVYADFSEYSAGGSPVWRQYPSAMICKVAESMALKRQFGIDGVVTREEMDASGDYSAPPVPAPVEVEPPAKKPSPDAARKRMFALAKKAELDESRLKRIMRALYGVTSSKDLTPGQVGHISDYLAMEAGEIPPESYTVNGVEAALAALDAEEGALVDEGMRAAGVEA